jgi:hypothetical protein
MGENFKIKTENISVNKSCKKTKGERLGWKSISEYKAVPLKEIIGNGSVVNETYSCQDTSVRLIQ